MSMMELFSTFEAAKRAGEGITLTPDQLELLCEHTDVFTRLAEIARPVPVPTPGLMSVGEVCRELRIVRQTLLNMRKSGRFIEPIQVSSRRFLFRRDDFNKWVASQPAA